MHEPCVLVVDDDRDLRETLRELLEDEGFATATATNGEEALEYLRSPGTTAPGVILLDLSMPVMDGATFRRVQRDDPALASIPVIVFSASSTLFEHVRELHVDAVLKKPVKLDELIDSVERFCSRRTL